MKIVISSKFLQASDISDGDKVTITNEGEYVTSKFGKQALQIGIKLPNGEEKTVSMNTTSQKFMIKKYGDDSKDWIGKEVPVFIVTQNVQGKFKKVIYFGQAPAEEAEEGSDNGEIDVEDIPY